jgi:hypothetical protein
VQTGCPELVYGRLDAEGVHRDRGLGMLLRVAKTGYAAKQALINLNCAAEERVRLCERVCVCVWIAGD